MYVSSVTCQNCLRALHVRLDPLGLCAVCFIRFRGTALVVLVEVDAHCPGYIIRLVYPIGIGEH